MFVSALIAIVNYSFLVDNVIENIFFSILTSSVVASVYYHLFIGNLYFKNIRRCIEEKGTSHISYFNIHSFLHVHLFPLIVESLFFPTCSYLNVWIFIKFRNLTAKNTVYFFVSNIIILPVILGLFFYGMSVVNAKI